MGGHMWGFLCCLILFCCPSLLSQTLFQEDFNYPTGDQLVSQGWSAHGSAGTNPVTVVVPGLMYAGHPGSGTGNAARLYETGEDVSRSIPGLSDTDVYVSFLVFVREATTSSSEHFVHLNIGTHVGRVFVKKAEGKIAFGIAKSTETAIFTEAVYSLNAVYLIAMRYTHLSGNDNDVVRFYVFESGIPSVEPALASLGPIISAGPEPSEITTVALRQGGSVVSDIVVDGFRIGTSWSDAGLPVTFSRFTASVAGTDVTLRWTTETEAGNYGFEIERREISPIHADIRGLESENDGGRISNQRQDETTNQRHDSRFTIHDSQQWLTIGFVPGSGTSSSPKDYSFVDREVTQGRYAYRIKQIDHSGASSYASSLDISVIPSPLRLTLAENYPNPFNPTTTIRFFTQDEARARIGVYDVAGRMVRVLLDEVIGAGVHEMTFDAGGLPSGTYLVRLQSGSRMVTRKVVLMR